MLYSLEKLVNENSIFNHKRNIEESDVVMVNYTINTILKNQKEDVPNIGDIVKFTDKYGNYREYAHIESIEDDLYVCGEPMYSIVDIKDDGYTTTTEGESWTHIPKKLSYVGKIEKEFLVWGYINSFERGTLKFSIPVNVWEYSK